MSDKESRAQEAASQYRVIKNKDGVFNLKRKENPSSIGFDIKHQAIMLNIDATPAELIWTADADKAPSFYVAFLNATEMRIGNSDDKGCSDLEENSIFVIDGENIQNLPLKRIRVLSAENYKEAEEKIAQVRGVIAEISKNEFASAKLSHIPKYDDDDELLLLTVGLPQDVFNKLVENNLSGRTTNVSLGGMCGALSSSPWHSSARDMIIQAGTSVSFGIDSITIKSQGIVKQKQAEDIKKRLDLTDQVHAAEYQMQLYPGQKYWLFRDLKKGGTGLTLNGPMDWSTGIPEHYEYITQIQWLGDCTWREVE